MNKLQWIFNQNTKIFIHENISENILCEMVAILSGGGGGGGGLGLVNMVLTHSSSGFITIGVERQ